MRARSRKTESVYRLERRPLVAALLAEPTVCPVVGCTSVADSPHEPATRARGGSITDPGNVVALCWEHNQNPPAEYLVPSMAMRHDFTGDEYQCSVCTQPRMSWRHR